MLVLLVFLLSVLCLSVPVVPGVQLSCSIFVHSRHDQALVKVET